MSKKNIAVVGVGNILMGDEGIGIKVLQDLEKKTYSQEVKFIDAGTAFFNVVSELRYLDKAIIIDAVHGGGKAGTVYRFKIDDMRGQSKPIISLHDFGVLESIQLEKVIAQLPDDIVFFGIEPENVTLSLELSPVVQGRVEYVVKKILEELHISGIDVLG